MGYIIRMYGRDNGFFSGFSDDKEICITNEKSEAVVYDSMEKAKSDTMLIMGISAGSTMCCTENCEK